MSENFFKLKKIFFYPNLTLSHLKYSWRDISQTFKDKAIFGMEGRSQSFKSQWEILW